MEGEFCLLKGSSRRGEHAGPAAGQPALELPVQGPGEPFGDPSITAHPGTRLGYPGNQATRWSFTRPKAKQLQLKSRARN